MDYCIAFKGGLTIGTRGGCDGIFVGVLCAHQGMMTKRHRVAFSYDNADIGCSATCALIGMQMISCVYIDLREVRKKPIGYNVGNTFC